MIKLNPSERFYENGVLKTINDFKNDFKFISQHYPIIV